MAKGPEVKDPALKSAVDKYMEANPEEGPNDATEAIKKLAAGKGKDEKDVYHYVQQWRTKNGKVKKRDSTDTPEPTNGVSADDAIRIVAKHFGGNVQAARDQLTALKELGSIDETLKAIEGLASLHTSLAGLKFGDKK